MGRHSGFKKSFLEILWITKNTLGTFWFWVPIIYFAYVLLQLWMMFYVHPFTLAIVPIILIIYGIRLEDKRTRARYGLKKGKRLPKTHGVAGVPEPVEQYEWEVERAVEQYESLLKNRENEEEKD